MARLVIPVLASVVVAYFALWVVTVKFLDFPTAVVCERGDAASVDVSSTRIRGYFDAYRLGPCVAYIHHSTHPGTEQSDFVRACGRKVLPEYRDMPKYRHLAQRMAKRMREDCGIYME
jgi:hypothetical protein